MERKKRERGESSRAEREFEEEEEEREREKKIVSEFEVVSSLVSTALHSSFLGFLVCCVSVLHHHGEKACGK